MLLVLDANEFIFALHKAKPSSQELVKLILTPRGSELCEIRIVRSIAKEVRRKLSPEDQKLFFAIQQRLCKLDEDIVIPFELVFRYEHLGLKPGDAAIAAYTEYVGATHLVTENRKDFLDHPDWFPFKVINADKFVKSLT